jgi:RNA-directed DNA polymerase
MLNKIKTINELALFLGQDADILQKLDPEKSYATFYMRKPGSDKKRLIEYPKGDLAYVLDRLCDGLQWLYLDHLTEAAYGFIRKIKPCNDPRDIYTNARRHLGKKYLLNIDLIDFFHQIDTEKVKNLFSDFNLFSFNPETEELLTRLVTFRGRLPMGSATSPPLSNFATIALDNDIQAWANSSRFVYTRFVDDLSFSSNLKISETHFRQISQILLAHRFSPNPDKIKFFGLADMKEVTGLMIGKTITVPDDYLVEFRKDITRYREMYMMVCQHPDGRVFEWLDKLKQVLNGRLAFLKMIQGANNETYRQFKAEIENLNQSEVIETSVSWRYAGYEYC